MIGEDRLRFRLRDRLRFRLKGRLRFPAPWAPFGGFPNTRAAFAGDCTADISTSASLLGDPCWVLTFPLRAVRPFRREAPSARGTSAVGCALNFPVTERGAVLSADRVVAGRRCLIVPAWLARPDASVRCRCASAGKGCTARPSLSRRSAGRCCNGPARRRPGGAR
jgi:hypothetical protein